MTEPKRYWWLKLPRDFFKSKRIKKLRSIAGGDTYTIIYLKMQLLSLQDDGYLYFDNVEDNFAEEIALDIDEKPDDVAITIQYLLAKGLLAQLDDSTYELPFTKENIGCETQSAVRKRRSREKQKSLQFCDNVTELSQNCHVEKEKEKEKEKDIDNNICAKNAHDLFEEVWNAYPKKKGKGQVSKTQKLKLLKIGKEELLRAVNRYLNEKKGTEMQFIQNGSTFFNSGYVDYLDSNYEQPAPKVCSPATPKDDISAKIMSRNVVTHYSEEDMTD